MKIFRNQTDRQTIIIFVIAFIVGSALPIIELIFESHGDKLEPFITGIIALHKRNELYWLFDFSPILTGVSAAFFARIILKRNAQVLDELSIYKGTIERNAEFAEKIGSGNFQTQFDVESDNDFLGKALLSMRDNLLNASIQEEERNWIMTGIAEVGQILRNNTELIPLGDEITVYLTKKVNAIQAAFYTVNDDNEKDRYIEMLSSYAYNKKKYLQAKFAFGQGLVGQSVIEQDTVFRTEIPNEYVTITSGLLGDKKPTAILIVPLITNEKVYGAVELASFEKFNATQIKFVQELSDIVARTIFNIKVNEKTKRLLEDAQNMSNELGEQQQQLLQNAEEMIATQDELTKSNARLEDQIQEVNNAQKRTQVLLENASEVISIYDAKGIIKYVSPSVTTILGYHPEELVGTSDIEFIHEKGRNGFNQLFIDLIENPSQMATAQFSYIKKDGERTWLEVSGKNLIHDPVIEGIVVNSRDISARRQAEKEQRIRAKMQALSENSLDLITRLEVTGHCSYINPRIEFLTGNETREFLGKEIDLLPVNEEVKGFWKSIILKVAEVNGKVNEEMVFPTLEGKLIMMVNAIPEYNDLNKLESVLVVSHDITEAKEREKYIQDQNNKIHESINYARRIQASILPKEIVLTQVFKKSFMMFMPKDIVSGDFPFIVQKGNLVYVAAVDCTGHGVPGALLSVIGSLILQEIGRYETPSAGVICDKLHAQVVKTLRQGEEGGENERDGMDIGMCRIDITTGELQYAGAHRPLYILRNNYVDGEELEQVKGDKYPIGGVQYAGRSPFENYELQLTKGDRIFVFSDGLPDQFGGTEIPVKKFGPKRIRDLIIKNKNETMTQNYESFRHDFHGWMGNTKQLDDVLLIGIEYE
jgi:PAS domain S-box-containing protein